MFLSKIFKKIIGKKSTDDNLKPNKLNINGPIKKNVIHLDGIECDIGFESWDFEPKIDPHNDNSEFEENFMNNHLNGLNEDIESNCRVEYIDDQRNSFDYKEYDNFDQFNSKFNENFMNNSLNYGLNEEIKSNYHVEYIDGENFIDNHLNNDQANESNIDYRVEYIDDQQNSFNLISEQNNFFNIIDVYTDGSKKRNGHAGSSFTLENHTTGHVIYKIYRLSNYCTSTCSELAAIYQALEFLINNEVSTSFIKIYTDFQYAENFLSDTCNKKVLGSKSSNIDLDIFRNQIKCLRSANNIVIIKWIKKDSHVLNQYADLFAKRGSRLNKINFNVSTIQIKKN